MLIATTRGWLSPGIHAPLVATGGTGNDEFIVYSNQAELRLEGDDDNDLFIVRAFALAAVCDTSADGDGDCDFADVDLEADPDTAAFPVDPNDDGICTGAENAGYDGEGWTGFRKDNNGDGVCNNADAHITGADDVRRRPPTRRSGRTTSSRSTPTASPARSSASASRPPGRSTSAPAAARTRSRTTSTRPVSVDGGTGFDKLVVLGTEFADDIVITAKGIFGAGLNVRYTNDRGRRGRRARGRRRVLRPVDRVRRRLPRHRRPRLRHDQRHRRRRRGHRHARARGHQRHDRPPRRRPRSTRSTTACRSTASTTTSRRPTSGVVIIDDDGPEGTSVREGGSLGGPAPIDDIDSYIDPARRPTRRDTVYVTVSAARSPQEEADDAFVEPGAATVTGPATRSTTARPTRSGCARARAGDVRRRQHDFQRYKCVNGVLVDENEPRARAHVHGGLGGTWNDRAVGLRLRRRRPALRGRPRRRRPALDDLRRTRTFDGVAGAQRRGRRCATTTRRASTSPRSTPGTIDEDRVARDRGRLLRPGDRAHARRSSGSSTPARDGLHRPHRRAARSSSQKDPGAGHDPRQARARRREPAGDPARLDRPRSAAARRGRTSTSDPRSGSPTTRSTSTRRTGTSRCACASTRGRRGCEDPQTAVITFVRDDRAVNDLIVPRAPTAPSTSRSATSTTARRPTRPSATSSRTSAPARHDGRRGHRRRDGRRRSRSRAASTRSSRSAATRRARRYDDPLTRARPDGRLVHDPAHEAADTARSTSRSSPTAWSTSSRSTASRSRRSGYQVDRRRRPVAALPRQPRDLGRRPHAHARQRQRPRQLRRRGLRGRRADPHHDRRRRRYDVEIADTSDRRHRPRHHARRRRCRARPRRTTARRATDTVSRLTRQGNWRATVTFVDTSRRTAEPGGWQVVRRLREPTGTSSGWLADGFLEGQWVEICSRRRRRLHRRDRPLQDRDHPRRQRRRRTTSSSSARTSTSHDVCHLVDDLAGVRATATCLVAPHRRRSRTFTDDRTGTSEQRDRPRRRRRLRRADHPPGRQGLPGLDARPLEAAGPARGRGRRHRRRPLAQARRSSCRARRTARCSRSARSRPSRSRSTSSTSSTTAPSRTASGTMTSTTLTGFGLAEGPRLRPDLLERQPADLRRAGDLPRRHQLRHRPVRRRQVPRRTAPRARSRSSTCCSASATTALDVQGTLDPDDAGQADRHDRDHSRRHAGRRSDGIDLTRPQPFDWKAQGFLVGQPVKITGFAGQIWTVVGFSDDDLDRHAPTTRVMHLSGHDADARRRSPPLPYSGSTTRGRRRVTVDGGADRRHAHARRPATGSPTASSSASGSRSAASTGDRSASVDGRCSTASSRRSLLGSGPALAGAAERSTDVTRRDAGRAHADGGRRAGAGDRADHDHADVGDPSRSS